MKRNVPTMTGVVIILIFAVVAATVILTYSKKTSEIFFGVEKIEEKIFDRNSKEDFNKTVKVRIPLIIANPSEEDFIEAKEKGLYVGCGDVVFYIEKDINYTTEPLKAAYEELFSLEEVLVVDEVDYINPIYYHTKGRSISIDSGDDWTIDPLEFEKVIVENGLASVYLTGNYATVGTCEPPRTQAVLEFSATQFDTVDSVNIYLNGDKMQFIHGGK